MISKTARINNTFEILEEAAPEHASHLAEVCT